jgi:hypothetical protein
MKSMKVIDNMNSIKIEKFQCDLELQSWTISKKYE